VTLQDAPVDLSATVAEFASFKAKFGKILRRRRRGAEAPPGLCRLQGARRDKKNAFALSVNSTARYGVTMFSDLSPEEFKAQYLNANKKQDVTRIVRRCV
jgi:hypothetical protein